MMSRKEVKIEAKRLIEVAKSRGREIQLSAAVFDDAVLCEVARLSTECPFDHVFTGPGWTVRMVP